MPKSSPISVLFRCQDVLSKRDGSKWREKIQLKQVSQWEIPEIKDVSEKDTPEEEKKPTLVTDKPKQAETEVLEEIPKKEILSPQEKFDKMKAQGNDYVKQVILTASFQISKYIFVCV